MGHRLATRNFAEELRGNKPFVREYVSNGFDNKEGVILDMNVG